ncbi:hypothetical protein ACA910_000391 [Epithemia clementina (nom. ined.)]
MAQDVFAQTRCRIVFALLIAFTPMWSTLHIPNVEAAFDKIIAFGLDQVICFSVNDAFVMSQWGLHLGLTKDPPMDQFQKVQDCFRMWCRALYAGHGPVHGKGV